VMRIPASQFSTSISPLDIFFETFSWLRLNIP
jgi:hypothetical protein